MGVPECAEIFETFLIDKNFKQMKTKNKYWLVIILIVMIPLWGIAQEPLSLAWEGEPIEDTVLLVGFTTDSEIVAHAVVTNNTDQSMDIKVRRTELQVVEGTLNEFCWAENCYPPTVDESFGHQTLGPGESSGDEDFSGHYHPLGNFGDSFIEYKFFNMNNESENVKFVAWYAATIVGVDQIADAELLVYPNPATDEVTIKSGSPIEQVLLYNQIGQLTNQFDVMDNAVNINISDQEPGLYFIQIQSSKQTTTRKLVIE